MNEYNFTFGTFRGYCIEDSLGGWSCLISNADGSWKYGTYGTMNLWEMIGELIRVVLMEKPPEKLMWDDV